MNTTSEVKVTLTRALFEQLSVKAGKIGVPLEWLVASLVVDMLEAGDRFSRAWRPEASRASRPSRSPRWRWRQA